MPVQYERDSAYMPRYNQNRQASQSRRLRDVRIDAAKSELDEAERSRRQKADIDRVTRETILSQQPQQGQAAAPQARPAPAVGRTGGAEDVGGDMPIGVRPAMQQPAAQPQAAPQGGFRSRLARNLATVEGGGPAAAEMTIAELDRQQKVMEKTFDLAASNPEMAIQWAEQNNMPVPAGMQNLLRNQQVAAAISNGMKRINAIYGTGAEQAERRWQAFMQLMQGIDEAVKQQGAISPQMQQGVATDMPQPAQAAADAPTLKKVYDRTTGREQYVQWNGQAWVPVGGVESPESARGRQGNPPAAVQTTEYLAGVIARTQGREAVTDQDRMAAFQQVQQAKTNPVSRANLAVRLYEAMAGDYFDERPPEEKWLDAQKRVNDLVAMPNASMPQQSAPAPQAGATGSWEAPPVQQPAPQAPAPQQPDIPLNTPQTQPSPFPEYPDAKQAPDGNWYIKRGNQYFMLER